MGREREAEMCQGGSGIFRRGEKGGYVGWEGGREKDRGKYG